MTSTCFPLVINSTNYVSGNRYTYNFGSSIPMGDFELALGKISLPYSWRNITAAKANNSFQIILPTSTTPATLTLTIPDGGYEVADLNAFLRYSLILNGYYIENTASLEQTVYCEFRVNASTYSIEFVSYMIPTSLPSGYTSGGMTFPAVSSGPQLTVTQSAFGKLIGFALGSYPAAAPTTLSVEESTVTPVLTEVQNVLVLVDSVMNPYSNNSFVTYALSPAGTAYGRTISESPSQLSYVPQEPSYRQSISITLTDQYYRPLELIDSDITIVLFMRRKL